MTKGPGGKPVQIQLDSELKPGYQASFSPFLGACFLLCVLTFVMSHVLVR